MFRKSIYTFLVIGCVAFSCTKERATNRAKEFFVGYEDIVSDVVPEAAIDRADLITIDIPDRGGQKVHLDELLDSVYYVKLETNNKCLIGNVDKIIAIKNRLIIIERLNEKSVLMFSDNGSFLTEISRTGKGPGEYISLSDVTVDKNKDEIVLFDGKRRKRLFFDLDGKFLREEPTYFYSTDFEILSDGNYLYKQDIGVNMHMPSVMDYNLIITTPDQKIVQKMIPDDLKNKVPSLKDFDNLHNLYAAEPSVLFTPRFSDTIFEINITGIKAKYHLNMGDRNAFQQLNPRSTVDDYYDKRNKDKLYSFNGVSFETNNGLFFRISNLGSCFYKKGTGELVWGDTFSDFSDNLVAFDTPIGSTGTFFIGVIWPHSIYPSDRKLEKSVAQMLEETKPEDNPILFFYTIKD